MQEILVQTNNKQTSLSAHSKRHDSTNKAKQKGPTLGKKQMFTQNPSARCLIKHFIGWHSLWLHFLLFHCTFFSCLLACHHRRLDLVNSNKQTNKALLLANFLHWKFYGCVALYVKHKTSDDPFFMLAA